MAVEYDLNLPPSVKENIQSQYENITQQSPETEFKKYGEPQGLLPQDTSFNKGLAYDSGLSEAIQQRAMKPYQTQMRGDNFERKIQSYNDYFNRLQRVANMVREEDAMNKQVIMNKYKAELQKRAARGQFIGQILGIGGAIAGGLAGGPAGAMAGYSIGSGVGQSGGSNG